MDFKQMRMECGLSIGRAAKLLEVTTRTVRNWEVGKTKPPKAVFLCLQLYHGDLSHLGKHRQGFRIKADVIQSPEGDFIHAQEIRAIRYVYQTAGIKRWEILKQTTTGK